MATWQQGINSGGFLAGIGQNNQNAPQASDANTALEYIRQNNENEWSGRNNVGLQALNGIAGNLQLYKQAQQADRQSEFQQAYGNAFASGDRNAMRQLAAQYPDQIDAVRNGMRFVDEDQRNTVGNLAAGARLASTSPDSMMSWLQNNAADLQRVGLNPMEVAQTYQQNPKAFSDFADHLGMAALGPDQYFNVQDKIAGNAITMRGQDISQQNAAQNNAIAMRGQDIQANLGQQRIDLDRENNRINMENKRYERQLQNETNDLKRQELQQKIDSNNQALQQKKNDLNSGYKDSINTLTTSMGTLNDILSSPSLKSITGIRGAIPNIPGSAAADVQARLDTFKSQAFLSAVSAMKGMGALSDAEGKKLDAAVGSLQNSQSEDAFKRNGKIIMDMYNQKRNDAVSKYVQQNGIQRVTAPQQSIDYLRQHPELSADFINRYGYLPSIGG
ncbi:TPA: phage DNA ejection protein [Klebsiella aerogenes]